MSKIIVEGSNRLSGEINVQGAKNSVLPVLAASILCRTPCVIHNCPDILDVDTALRILKHLGCKCQKQGTTVVCDASSITNCDIPENLMREMRSSVVFLGAILSRFKRASISSPGGCELGPRPIDLHLSSLKALGAEIEEDHGYLQCNAENGLYGKEIHLSFPSVGATENIILAAVCAKGKTVIHNAAREPEISDLADFLNRAGGKICGCGSDTIEIEGVSFLNGIEHSIIPDRIAASTYLCACATANGKITLNGVIPAHMISVLSVLRDAGCDLDIHNNKLTISVNGRLNRVPTVRTLVHPGFPTDAGPCVIAMLSRAKGTSVFVENIFENRFRYIDELNRLGTKIKTEGRVAVIDGTDHLEGASCSCTDLRGGAALVVAALSSEGVTEINNISHILRGYDNITETLCGVGAKIKLVV
ncbi:MAG: UDP-N-acetylglucosamine 1-carboxyvinyltransferase [Ruminococcaceae bacterium]|nr:UDP-N-acetylglucosamine 1-carboxyvinyltransferase [Oscillospiraceae bacterium]